MFDSDDFVSKERVRIEDELRILDPKSEEYKVLLERRRELGDKKNGKTMEIIFRSIEIGITAIGSIMVPISLARLSYMKDQDIGSLCNGRIWNLGIRGIRK